MTIRSWLTSLAENYLWNQGYNRVRVAIVDNGVPHEIVSAKMRLHKGTLTNVHEIVLVAHSCIVVRRLYWEAIYGQWSPGDEYDSPVNVISGDSLGIGPGKFTLDLVRRYSHD